MKKPRFTEQQIAVALRQADQGTPAGEIRRKLGVSEALRVEETVRGPGGPSCAACGNSRMRIAG
jgi:putative transposase